MEGRIRHLEPVSSRRRDRRGRRCRHPSQPGCVVSVRYEGDDDDEIERYLVGSIEERRDGLDVMSPGSPLGAALIGAKVGDDVSYEAPTRQADRRSRQHRCLKAPSARRTAGSPRSRPDDGSNCPGEGRLVRARDRRAPGRRDGRSCCTAGPSPPTSTGSRSFESLGARFHVVAFDHRGHGRGCARAAASGSTTAPTTLPCRDALGIERFVAVGYSMGGAVATLVVATPPRPRRRTRVVRDRVAVLRHARRSRAARSARPDLARDPSDADARARNASYERIVWTQTKERNYQPWMIDEIRSCRSRGWCSKPAASSVVSTARILRHADRCADIGRGDDATTPSCRRRAQIRAGCRDPPRRALRRRRRSRRVRAQTRDLRTRR